MILFIDQKYLNLEIPLRKIFVFSFALLFGANVSPNEGQAVFFPPS